MKTSTNLTSMVLVVLVLLLLLVFLLAALVLLVPIARRTRPITFSARRVTAAATAAAAATAVVTQTRCARDGSIIGRSRRTVFWEFHGVAALKREVAESAALATRAAALRLVCRVLRSPSHRSCIHHRGCCGSWLLQIGRTRRARDRTGPNAVRAERRTRINEVVRPKFHPSSNR